MLLKEKQFNNSSSPKLRAGEEAEKQMAFYLQREFGKSKECFLINDLRITNNGDASQIDHLIVSRYGLFIIESKSVHGKVIVNEHNEWARTFNDKIEGMPSPVLQAQEQGRNIKELLIGNRENLLGKMLFGSIQKGFGYCPVFVYIAISDSGVIERKCDVPELFKADKVAKEIAAKLKDLESRVSILNPKVWETSWDMKVEEARTVADFLVAMHRPLSRAEREAPTSLGSAAPAEKPDKAFVPKIGAVCPQCGKHKLTRKSIARSDGTETDFLACAGYPSTCKALFALVAIARPPKKQVAEVSGADTTTITVPKYVEGEPCPSCKKGTLVSRKGKTQFLGCSSYPKCKFTDYRDQS